MSGLTDLLHRVRVAPDDFAVDEKGAAQLVFIQDFQYGGQTLDRIHGIEDQSHLSLPDARAMGEIVEIQRLIPGGEFFIRRLFARDQWPCHESPAIPQHDCVGVFPGGRFLQVHPVVIAVFGGR